MEGKKEQGRALWRACRDGRLDDVQRILNECQSDPYVVHYERRNECAVYTTPLCRASKGGHIAIMELLISNGADVDDRIINGYFRETSLHGASRNNHIEAMELLLRHGAKIEAINRNGLTPLIVAIYKGNSEAINVLLHHGASIEAKDRQYGWTALLMASNNGHNEAMEALLQHGADIEAKMNDGMTALAFASKSGNSKAVKILLDNGASVHVKDQSGKTPLDHALLYLSSHTLHYYHYGTQREALSTVHLLLRSVFTQI